MSFFEKALTTTLGVAGIGLGLLGQDAASKEARRAKELELKALELQFPEEFQELRKQFNITATEELLPRLLGGTRTTGEFGFEEGQREEFLAANPELAAQVQKREEQQARLQTLTEEIGALPPAGQPGGGAVPGLTAEREELRRDLEKSAGIENEINRAFAEQTEGVRFDAETGQLQSTEEIAFEDTILGRLGEAGEIELDPRIGETTEELIGEIGTQSEANKQALIENAVQTGAITQEEVASLRQIQQQTGGSIAQATESLFGPGGLEQRLGTLEQQIPGSLAESIGATQEIVRGGGRFGQELSQFTGDISGAIAGAQQTQQNVLGDAEDLIRAAQEESKFQEQQALETLNDQLSARGLADSGAAIEAINDLQQRFARQRNVQSAQIRQQARSQQFEQNITSSQTIGNLAAQGFGAGLQGNQQQLAAAGQLAGLELGGTEAQAGLIGQQTNIAQLGQQLGIEGGQFGANISNLIGQLGQTQAGIDLQRALQQAGISVAELTQERGLLTEQQQIEQNVKQQNFLNLLTTNAAQFQPLLAAIGQAGAGGAAAGASAAGFAGAAATSAAAQAAGSGQLVSAGANLITTAITPQVDVPGTQPPAAPAGSIDVRSNIPGEAPLSVSPVGPPIVSSTGPQTARTLTPEEALGQPAPTPVVPGQDFQIVDPITGLPTPRPAPTALPGTSPAEVQARLAATQALPGTSPEEIQKRLATAIGGGPPTSSGTKRRRR